MKHQLKFAKLRQDKSILPVLKWISPSSYATINLMQMKVQTKTGEKRLLLKCITKLLPACKRLEEIFTVHD